MQLTEFCENDYQNIYAFMKPLWQETYGGFLPKAQISFLLDTYFSEEGLERFRKQGYRYYTVDDSGVLVFVEKEEYVYLDKLYLLPTARGKGYPELVFNWLMERFEKPVRLNVNQKNERAVRCYLKNGFQIIEKVDIPLENGLVNCDYVMQKNR